MEKFSQTIVWTHFPWHRESVTARDGLSVEQVKIDVVDYAVWKGWTPPKWWQFWRWRDTRLSELTIS